MNNVTAFLETLVASSGEYNAAKVSELSFLNGVYLDVKAEVARNGKTIQVYFPDLGPVTDQQANAWTPEDINPNYVNVVFNQRPGKAIKIHDFDQWQTSVEIADKFYDPMFKRSLEYFNNQIASLINTTNFNTYNTVVCSTPMEIGVRDAARAWNRLANNKVPVSDPNMLNLFKHNDVHSTMVADTQWNQESLVGVTAAEKARQAADLGASFKFRHRWDQQAPRKTVALTGTIAATNGSATLTGTSTSFSSQVNANDNIILAGDTTETPYRVLTVGSNTSITLTGNYTGATISGSAGTTYTYTCLAAHKYAIALAVRPLELVNNGQTQSRLVKMMGIPFRVQISYEHSLSAYLLTMDAGCAVAVLRPDFGAVVQA